MGVEKLDDAEIGRYSLKIRAKQTKIASQKYFKVFLKQKKIQSEEPVLEGLYSSGVPSENIRPWLDLDYYPDFKIGGKKTSLSETPEEKKLFKLLAGLVPETASMMVSYSLFARESKIHRETKKMLKHGKNPEETPVGKLMLYAGFSNQKDWYFPEGGLEGNQKIQGFKHTNK